MAIRKLPTRAAILENLEISGTEAAKMPIGTTAQRANVASGDIRFNSTTNLMEYYDGTAWKSIDSPPSVSSVSPDNFDTAGDTITVSGAFFSSDATITVVANDGSTFSPTSTTYTSQGTMSFDITQAMVDDDNDPYDVKVTNGSGLSYTLENALDFAPEPVFATASGSIGTIRDIERTSYSLSAVTATSTESDATITYALGSGDSLPAGLSLNTSSGAITGTATAVGSNTTTTFDIVATATDGDSNVTTNTREFSITVNAPVITSYTSTGSGTFSVPSGVTAVNVLVVAGGGSGGCDTGGGGGAGGLIYRPAFPVTPGGSVSYTVGGGGSYSPVVPNGQNGNSGQNSVFGTLTAQGGGGGVSGGLGTQGMSSGGSGGGGRRDQSSTLGTGTQPQQPGDSGTYGFGNPGWTGDTDTYVSGGGGGAGGAAPTTGSRASAPTSNAPYLEDGGGGAGKSYDISGSSVTYAGGGGGGTEFISVWQAGGGPGGGGKGGHRSMSGQYAATSGTANRGGGGGGAGNNPEGGSGGSGIVIVAY